MLQTPVPTHVLEEEVCEYSRNSPVFIVPHAETDAFLSKKLVRTFPGQTPICSIVPVSRVYNPPPSLIFSQGLCQNLSGLGLQYSPRNANKAACTFQSTPVSEKILQHLVVAAKGGVEIPVKQGSQDSVRKGFKDLFEPHLSLCGRSVEVRVRYQDLCRLTEFEPPSC